ncbi:MAG: hypothetical protein ACKVT2_18240, partial [Saprospiraceae bacterium]
MLKWVNTFISLILKPYYHSQQNFLLEKRGGQIMILLCFSMLLFSTKTEAQLSPCPIDRFEFEIEKVPPAS